MHPVDGERESLTLAGRLALDIEELGRVRDWVEDDHELRRQLQRQNGLLAGRELDGLERDLVDQPRKIFWKINPGPPKDLPAIFRKVKPVGIVRRYPAHPGIDRERHLDHLIERGLVAGGAEGAAVLAPVHGLQRCSRVEHAAAARAQYVPGQLEDAKPRGMQERRDYRLGLRAPSGGEIQHVDAAELAIGALTDQSLDGGRDSGIGRLPQGRELDVPLAHARNPRLNSDWRNRGARRSGFAGTGPTPGPALTFSGYLPQ